MPEKNTGVSSKIPDSQKKAESSMTPGDVHLWIAFPDDIRDPDLSAAYGNMMTEEERRRQQRFLREPHRHLALVARALVRTTLSRYADVAPEQWRFSFNRHGRPEVAFPGGSPRLRFNLSHTRGIVVCAVTAERDIGVDVEDALRSHVRVQLAERYFSTAEVRDLHAAPASQQRERFLEYWTLKEAYIKARGKGLSIPLERFAFQIKEGYPLGVSFDPLLDDRPDGWFFCLMQTSGRYKAAVAVQREPGEVVRVSCRETVPLVADRAAHVEILHASRQPREPD